MNLKKWLLTIVLIVANLLLGSLMYLEVFPMKENLVEQENTLKEEVVGSVVDVATKLQVSKIPQEDGSVLLELVVPESIQINSASFEMKVIVNDADELDFSPSEDFPLLIKDKSISNSLELVYSGANNLYLNTTGVLELGSIIAEPSLNVDAIRILSSSEIYLNGNVYEINE